MVEPLGTVRIMAAVLLCATLWPVAGSAADVNQHERRSTVLGAEVHLRVYHKDKAVADRAMRKALREVARIGRKLDASRRYSEISSINKSADREEVVASSETYDLIETALKLCRETNRTFDLTVQSFDYLWDFRRRPPVRPLADEVKARLALSGCSKVALKPNRSVRLLSRGVRITLADVVHGHAVQRAGDILRAEGIDNFRLRIGNDLYVQGRVGGTRHWYVLVRHPANPDKTVTQLYLTSHAVATRHHNERFFFKGGKRYHDILDPRTGRPAGGVALTTIIGTDPVQVDALSRAVFVMGVAKGLKFIDKTAATEGFIIDDKGLVHASKGMSELARLPASIEL